MTLPVGAPVLVSLEAHPAALERVGRELRQRHGRDVDYWVPRPWRTPDESFHRAISEFLSEWNRLYRPATELVRVVGRDWDGPTLRCGTC